MSGNWQTIGKKGKPVRKEQEIVLSEEQILFNENLEKQLEGSPEINLLDNIDINNKNTPILLATKGKYLIKFFEKREKDGKKVLRGID